jgi:phosphoglycerol transferase MdoB-like AlkP superfamily enzyme
LSVVLAAVIIVAASISVGTTTAVMRFAALGFSRRAGLLPRRARFIIVVVVAAGLFVLLVAGLFSTGPV